MTVSSCNIDRAEGCIIPLTRSSSSSTALRTAEKGKPVLILLQKQSTTAIQLPHSLPSAYTKEICDYFFFFSLEETIFGVIF